MKAINFLGLFFLVVLMSCGKSEEKKGKIEKAKGTITVNNQEISIYKGGIFRMNQDSKPSSLFPHGLAELSAHHIANQVYQGLVRLNQATLEVENCLAQRIEINDDATV